MWPGSCLTVLDIMFLQRYCELALVEPDTAGTGSSCGGQSKEHLTLWVFLKPGYRSSSASGLPLSPSCPVPSAAVADFQFFCVL